MAEKLSYVYLRLSAGVRHSQLDFEELEALAGGAALQNDSRDRSVYFFALPEEIDPSSANRIISSLVIQPHIEEAWHTTGNTVFKPPPYQVK